MDSIENSFIGTSEWNNLYGELQKRMGRNLMLFQAIEHSLKFLLPYIHPDGSKKDGLNTFNFYKESIKTNTLGQLMAAYRKSIDINASEEVTNILCRQFTELVASRNILAHGLFTQPGITTRTVEELNNGLRYLDEQYRQAESFYRDISPHLFILTGILLERSECPDDKLIQLYRLLERNVISYATVNVRDDSLDSNWVDVELVKLLKLAESEVGHVDGWTYLGTAGNFIKSRNKEISPMSYGLKSLKAVLIASGLFEVREEGSTILYKSKEPYFEIIYTE